MSVGDGSAADQFVHDLLVLLLADRIEEVQDGVDHADRARDDRDGQVDGIEHLRGLLRVGHVVQRREERIAGRRADRAAAGTCAGRNFLL